MKIIHCADLHLDPHLEAGLTREQINTRKMDFLRSFRRVVEYGAANGVKLVLMAGDIFDTRNVSASVRNQLRKLITDHPDMDFLYLRGNHNNDNFLSRMDEIPDNLLLFGYDWTVYEYGPVCITGIELKDGQALTRAQYAELDLRPEDYNIVMLHGGIEELPDSVGTEQPIASLQKLRHKNINYLALGHLHQYRFGHLDSRGYYCYTGCLEERGFSEIEEHGFMLIEIDDQTLRSSFDFKFGGGRNHCIIPVDISGVISTTEASERIETVLKKQNPNSNCLVRILLKGRIGVDTELSIPKLMETFKDYFFYTEIRDETELYVEYSDFEKDTSLRGEFIRTVLRSDLDPQKKSAIIRCGAELLAGEEI